MSDYVFPEAPEVEKAYRAAHRALEGVVSPGSFVPEGDLSVTEVISQFRSMVEKAEMAVVAQFGPLIAWEAPRREGDWELVMTGANLDDANAFGAVRLGGAAFEGLRAAGVAAHSTVPPSLTSARVGGTSRRVRLVSGC